MDLLVEYFLEFYNCKMRFKCKSLNQYLKYWCIFTPLKILNYVKTKYNFSQSK